jgi:thymidylate kinase
LILDEGVIQRATTLYASPSEDPDALKIEQYIAQLPQADLAIWVKTSLDVCLARVVARGTKTRYVGQELRSFIANSAKTLEIATRISKGLGWEIIQVNNDDTLAESTANLRNELGKRVCQYV